MALAETYLGKTVMNNGDSSEEEEGRPQTKSHYIPEMDDDQGDGSLAPFEKASKQKKLMSTIYLAGTLLLDTLRHSW